MRWTKKSTTTERAREEGATILSDVECKDIIECHVTFIKVDVCVRRVVWTRATSEYLFSNIYFRCICICEWTCVVCACEHAFVLVWRQQSYFAVRCVRCVRTVCGCVCLSTSWTSEPIICKSTEVFIFVVVHGLVCERVCCWYYHEASSEVEYIYLLWSAVLLVRSIAARRYNMTLCV